MSDAAATIESDRERRFDMIYAGLIGGEELPWSER